MSFGGLGKSETSGWFSVAGVIILNGKKEVQPAKSCISCPKMFLFGLCTDWCNSGKEGQWKKQQWVLLAVYCYVGGISISEDRGYGLHEASTTTSLHWEENRAYRGISFMSAVTWQMCDSSTSVVNWYIYSPWQPVAVLRKGGEKSRSHGYQKVTVARY